MTAALPFNAEAEEHVVGACLHSATARETVAELLHPSQLYNARLAQILEACLQAHDRGQNVDPVILADSLPAGPVVQAMRELAGGMHPAANVHHHALIVREHATRRELIRVGQDIARAGWEPPDNLEDALSHAEELVYDLTVSHESGELRHISETLDHTFELLARPGGEITGTPTGLDDLDRLTAGLQPGNLVVVAARPGMGKSALALQAALHTAELDKPAAVFTLEMSAEEINQRALSVLARVPLMRIRTRNGLTMDDRAALDRARHRLEQAALYIDDTVSARVTDIRTRARRLKAKQPNLALVVVDYLQLMIHEGTGRENREQQVAAISRGLKLLARELELPVMALAQLNRNPEHRADKQPMLADLRDSGAIEQDADVVVFIHRDTSEDADPVASLTVAKHRNGPTDHIQAAWVARYATFNNLAEGL